MKTLALVVTLVILVIFVISAAVYVSVARNEKGNRNEIPIVSATTPLQQQSPE